MHKVVVAGKIHPSGMSILEARKDIALHTTDDNLISSVAPHFADMNMVLLRTQLLSADAIKQCPQLSLVSRHGVGFDTVDVDALNARNIPLTVVGDVNARTVAEHTMMLLLATTKRLRFFDQSVRDGQWEARSQLIARDLNQQSLLIVGLGRIGRHVCAMAHAFGMRIFGYDPYLTTPLDSTLGITVVDDLHRALRDMDAISLHIPKVQAPIIGKKELDIMKSSAVVINAARGGAIDEDALAEALTHEQIGGAGLDVFSTEPVNHDHPLFGSDRVICTPHIAGLTLECAERMAIQAAQNIVNFIDQRLDRSLVANAQSIEF